jgi:uncharacterized protein (TIGR02246 family)
MTGMHRHEDADTLYTTLIAAWNRRDAAAMAACFGPDGVMIGFDGSTAVGPVEIAGHFAPIFAHHRTPTYVTLVADRREIAPGVTLLRAHSGLVPDGQADLAPNLNAIHTVVATAGEDGAPRIALFQNTPAAFHGRPDAHEAFTAALRALLPARHETP